MTHVTDPAGRTAELEALSGGRARLRLDDGQRLDLPEDLLAAEPDGTYRSSLPFDQALGGGEREEQVFLEVEERLRVGREERETGRVRVTRRVESREEVVDEPGWREHVEVERVPVGEYVTEVASVREEEGVTVIPVYEEVLVVERRILLKEEVRLRKTREETHEPQRVTVRRTVVDVERTEGGDEPPSRGA